MKERSILFSAPMVRAILDGRKTVTRRVVKPQPTHFNPVGVPRRCVPTGGPSDFIACPYGKPGDRLWVREAWRVIDLADVFSPREITAAHRIWFETDGPHEPPAGRYRPGMFMPRWASRILLEVTGVRVERLQDISEADALAEGVQCHPFRPDDGWPICTGYMIGPDDGKTTLHPKPQDAYRRLWESINGPGSWDANPWVWVIEFKRVEAA